MFRRPHSSEYYALVVASVTLLLVLVSCYVATQLYQSRRGPRPEGFLSPTYYNPTCRTDFTTFGPKSRSDCKGFTTGVMPSIEADTRDGNWLCPGMLGTQP